MIPVFSIKAFKEKKLISSSSKHCTEPYPVSCNLQKSCSFVLNTDVKICNGKIAQYIFINYRFIPSNRFISFEYLVYGLKEFAVF